MTVRGYLEADGFEVVEAPDGPAGLQAVTRDRPDLVVLDVMMPGLDGFQVLRRIRETSPVPVILLTARGEEVDRLIGFTTGSDDYVVKPFSPRELALRVRAVLRRTDGGPEAAQTDAVLRFDGLTVDPDTRTVLVDSADGSTGDREVELSALDFDLLLAMARTPGRVFTRRGLLAQVWGEDFFGDERVVDVHIRTLRRALGDDASAPRLVGTVRTIGYRFVGRPVTGDAPPGRSPDSSADPV
ncbi:DNA-binding response regulator [Streptomyces spinoverrucosus]|uniref:DNA-binding response regulator n=2 Tax=Streptomyces spinoverrucosus TaxID=284043 RepID=A0A4Y3VWN2_9ACTN|nr:DNA-binding response regulator [Streptomyces spinoverrucosus]GHB69143.1 DNA-binding response regulator [Streptomyces spinoverrucosus]